MVTSDPGGATYVLDASAVLALLFQEYGADQVAQYLDGALLSTVNLAEVVQKLRQYSDPTTAAEAPTILAMQGVKVCSTFSEAAAVRSAELWSDYHQLGLSLGDRCCLALVAETPNGVAVTTDTAWQQISETDIEVLCIR